MLRTPQQKTSTKRQLVVAVIAAAVYIADILLTALIVDVAARWTLETWTSLTMSYGSAMSIVVLLRLLKYELFPKDKSKE